MSRMIMNLEEAASHFDCTTNALVLSARAYRERHGTTPPWYFDDTPKHRVDVGMIEQKRYEDVIAINACHELYFELSPHFKDYKMAEYLAGQLGGTQQSWAVFLSKEMWRYCTMPDSKLKTGIGDRFHGFLRVGRELLFLVEESA